MGGAHYLLKINIRCQLHVLGVNAQDLQAARGVGDANVNLAIETAETAQGHVNRIRAVGCTHNNHVLVALHAVHEGQQLRNDTPLHLAMRLVTLGRDRVDLVDENDCRRVLAGLLEGSPQIALRFAWNRV